MKTKKKKKKKKKKNFFSPNKNPAILQTLGHARVATSVVEHEPFHESCLHCGTVLHRQDFNHEQIDGTGGTSHNFHRLSDHGSKSIGQLCLDLGAKSTTSDTQKLFSVVLFPRLLQKKWNETINAPKIIAFLSIFLFFFVSKP